MEILIGREFWTACTQAKDPGLLRNLYKIRYEVLATRDSDHSKARNKVEAWFKGNGVSESYEFFRPKGSPLFWHKAIWKKRGTLFLFVLLSMEGLKRWIGCPLLTSPFNAVSAIGPTNRTSTSSLPARRRDVYGP